MTASPWPRFSANPFNITDAARRHGNEDWIYLRDYVDGVDLYKELHLEFALPGDKTSPLRPTN